MNLLPKSHSEFGSSTYWENFFAKRGQKAFEWYGEYPELCGILHKYVKPKDKILNIGCGNSTLSADLYDVGYKQIVNIDISTTVIRQMTEKYQASHSDMKFLQMDLLKMDFLDSEFGVVLDKGTLDALFTDESQETVQKIEQMFAEIGRILKIGGRYICVSLAQSQILNKVVQYFPNKGWMTRICRVTDSDGDEKEFHMPVFVFVFTKFKKMSTVSPILEISPFDDKVERCSNVDEFLHDVKLMQNYGIIRQQLNKGTSHLNEHISLDLHSAELSSPRYTVYVVDSKKQMPNKFAVFIVPEGRETEWLFSSFEGRKELARNAGFGRLLVVTLHREHTYTSLDAVKAELSTKVMDMAPPFIGKQPVPYLSLGDEICQRTIRFRGTSKLSGDFIVEDVQVESELYRRLIFMNNKTLSQSEVKLVPKKKKKKGSKKNATYVPNTDELCCNYYSTIVAGLALIDDPKNSFENGFNILLVGLGGGGLPIYIHKYFRKAHLEVVEIDDEIVKTAENWFGLVQDARLKVHIDDGLEFVSQKSLSGSQYTVIMIDVDNKNQSVGMNCPPEDFVTPAFLEILKSCLKSEGLLIINMACRNQQLRSKTLDTIKSIFTTVYSRKIPEDVNEIVFAFATSKTFVDTNEQMATKFSDSTSKCISIQQNLQILQSSIKSNQGTSPNASTRASEDSTADLMEALTEFHLS